LVLVWPIAATAKPKAPATQPATAPVRPGERLLDEYLSQGRSRVTLHAIRLSDGHVLVSRDAETPMVPASVQKICTAAIALAILGADFQFTTTLATNKGDALVLGDGDPLLGDPVLAEERKGAIYDTLDAWAAQLKAAGVTAVRGDLVLDDEIFQERRHADWPAADQQRWFCAPASGLNFNNNCLDVTIRVEGGVVKVETSPASRYVRVIDRVRAGRKQTWRLSYAEDDAQVRIDGEVRQSMAEPLSVAVNRPSLLLGRVLADRLATAGVGIEGQIVRRRVLGEDGKVPVGLTIIARHSTPLTTVMMRMNKRSLNLAGECLLLRAAAKSTGRATYEQAVTVGGEILAKEYGLDARQFTISDGSGLSRGNRLSAAAAASLLVRLAKGEQSRMFLDSLPVAGVDGSLAERLVGCSGRVLAKTGTLSNVSSLAGYVLDPQGRPEVAFAIFCNDAPAWRARQVQDALVADWVGDVDAALGTAGTTQPASRPASRP